MREPDLKHPRAPIAAWRCKVPPTRPDHMAHLAGWLVRGPFHPSWNHWCITLVHLRDISGVPPAKKRHESFTHEILFASLDPREPTPDPDVGGFVFLEPLDVVEQFGGLADAQAIQLLDMSVRLIVDGRASPDSDWRRFWKQCIANTVEHILTGGHHSKPGHA